MNGLIRPSSSAFRKLLPQLLLPFWQDNTSRLLFNSPFSHLIRPGRFRLLHSPGMYRKRGLWLNCDLQVFICYHRKRVE